MVKSILYTKNPENTTSFEEVAAEAQANNNYYYCLTSEENWLNDLEPGTHILTTKNNHLYILETSYRTDAYSFAKASSITEPVMIEQKF